VIPILGGKSGKPQYLRMKLFGPLSWTNLTQVTARLDCVDSQTTHFTNAVCGGRTDSFWDSAHLINMVERETHIFSFLANAQSQSFGNDDRLDQNDVRVSQGKTFLFYNLFFFFFFL
jgi:hypothetical protein